MGSDQVNPKALVGDALSGNPEAGKYMKRFGGAVGLISMRTATFRQYEYQAYEVEAGWTAIVVDDTLPLMESVVWTTGTSLVDTHPTGLIGVKPTGNVVETRQTEYCFGAMGASKCF